MEGKESKDTDSPARSGPARTRGVRQRARSRGRPGAVAEETVRSDPALPGVVVQTSRMAPRPAAERPGTMTEVKA
jgi:hypothetical protein